MKCGEFDHEIFFSPSPPEEEKGIGDEEVGAGYEMASTRQFSKHLRSASTPVTYLMWQLVRNRQRCQAKLRRQHKLGSTILDFFDQKRDLLLNAMDCHTLLKNVLRKLKSDSNGSIDKVSKRYVSTVMKSRTTRSGSCLQLMWF